MPGLTCVIRETEDSPCRRFKSVSDHRNEYEESGRQVRPFLHLNWDFADSRSDVRLRPATAANAAVRLNQRNNLTGFHAHRRGTAEVREGKVAIETVATALRTACSVPEWHRASLATLVRPADGGRMATRKGGDTTASTAFVEYTRFIVNHPVYEGMPDAWNENGAVQWEAPSNRGSGKHKDTHQKRRAWWRDKALAVGIDPTADQWISRTAKSIHPTGEKPCKRCGRVMSLRYVYPSGHLARRLGNLGYLEESDLPEKTEDVYSIVERLHAKFGNQFLADATRLFTTAGIRAPRFPTVDAILSWLKDDYVPQEPSTLSPGAMSNAPDRFEGFHSFNLCCRSKADSGRHSGNLRSYVTDRRVFEYWVDGDWVAADRMMGLVRTKLADEPCANGHDGPCSADHIGPISLGFSHRPEFQLLCGHCNGAKNNRMTMRDVQRLIAAEAQGEDVVSWHSRALWERCKDRVGDDETALRLSKLMRDNRHTLMDILQRVYAAGHYSFLVPLLNLEYAEWDVTFEGLHVSEGYTAYSEMVRIPRTTTYAREQKARRCRIAFGALEAYWVKANRNAYVAWSDEAEARVLAALEILNRDGTEVPMQAILARALSGDFTESVDTLFRGAVAVLPSEWPPEYEEAFVLLRSAMDDVAETLSRMWDDERYVRTIYDASDEDFGLAAIAAESMPR